MMRKNWLVGIALLVGALVALPTAVEAAVNIQPCADEPTDELIDYGDLRTCAIDPVGDLDTFRFAGLDGETATIVVSRTAGLGNPWLQLFRPDGTLFDMTDGDIRARLDAALDQTGEWTILVRETGNNATFDYNVVLERIAPPSPTASVICPGCTISDRIDPYGDLDLFIFEGSPGDTVIIVLSKTDGSGYTSCELFRPDGTRFRYTWGSSGCSLNETLDQTGTWTIVVREDYENGTFGYNLSFECISGTCQAAPPVTVCDMQMSKDTYTNGETVTAQAFRLANLSADPVPIELKTWFVAPGVPNPFGHINVGADGSGVFPPGFDRDYGPIPLFTVTPGAPRGTYEYNCRLLHPVTGQVKAVDLNAFEIQ